MKLHADKFIFVNFNTRHKNFSLSQLPFYEASLQYTTSEGLLLEPSNQVTDLGVTFSDNLSWINHVTNLTKKAKQISGWVLSCFKTRSPEVMKTLYKSLVRSHLEYCCPLWFMLPLESLRSLEAIQRSFTNKITYPQNVSNYWQRLKFLGIMSLQRRRERYAIIHLWKIRYGITSNDPEINFYDSPRFGILARIPPISSHSKMKARTLYDAT